MNNLNNLAVSVGSGVYEVAQNGQRIQASTTNPNAFAPESFNFDNAQIKVTIQA